MGQTKKAKSQVFGVIALFLAVLAVILSLFGVFNTPINVNAGYVKEFNFQGRLTNPDGTNVADGVYDMIFKIYNVPSDGIVLWKEYHTGGNKVTVEDGVFNVNLGSINEINLNFNSGVYYLGIEVNGDGEMTPRRRIGGTGYSLNTERVYGVPGSLTDTNIDTFPEEERGILDALNYLNTTAIPAAGMWADSGGNLHPKATVSQDVSIPDGRLHVSGAVSFDSTLGVTGATTLSSTLLVSGATDLSSTLTVSSTSNLVGAVTFGSGVTSYIFPTARGADNQVLVIDGSGNVTWQNQSGGFADPMTTRGDIIYRNAANTTTRLGVGAANTVLISDGTDISYQPFLWDQTGIIIHPYSLTDDFAIGANGLVAPFSVDESLNTVRIGEGSGGTATNAILNMYASNDSTGAITYTTNDLWEFSGGNIYANGGLVGIGSGANGMPTTGRSLNIYNAANNGYGVYTAMTGAAGTIYGNYITATGAATSNYGVYSAVSGASEGNFAGYFVSSLAATPTSPAYGVEIRVTSDGSAGFDQGALNVILGGDYSGGNPTYGVATQNLATGSGLNIGGGFYSLGGGATNYGVYGSANAASATNAGGYFTATSAATTNYGIYAIATGATNNWAGYFAGNVGLGGSATAPELRIYEDTDTGTNYSAFKVGNQSTDVTYTLPLAVAGGSGYVLTGDATGALSWTAPGSLGVRWNEITAPNGDQTLAMSTHATTFNWDTTSGNAFTLTGDSLTSGTLLNLTSTSTAAAGDAQKVLNIDTSGANGTAGQMTYGLYASNTHTGTTSENVAGYFTASGAATANYGIQSVVSGGDSDSGYNYGAQLSVTGTAAAYGYGIHSTVTGTALNQYGVYQDITGGTSTNYGDYSVVYGGSTSIGAYSEVYGADENYGFLSYVSPTDDGTGYGGYFLVDNSVGASFNHYGVYSSVVGGLFINETFHGETTLADAPGSETYGAYQLTVVGVSNNHQYGFYSEISGSPAAEAGISTAVYGRNITTGDNDTEAWGVQGVADAAGVTSAYGVAGSGTGGYANYGGYFTALDDGNDSNYGIYAWSEGKSNVANYGVYSLVSGDSPINEAFHGDATLSAESDVYGGYLTTTIGSDGDDVQSGFYSVITGTHDVEGTTATTYAIQGINETTYGGSARVDGYGVYGSATGANHYAYGVYGWATGSGITWGVYASAAGSGSVNYGVYGTASGATTNWAGYFVGNVALGGSATAPELRIYEATGSGTNYTAFKATAQAADITYTLPSAVAGGSGYVLTGDATGALSWSTTPSVTVPLSSITAATATNSINSANYAQTWAWNSLTDETAMTMSSTSMTRGKILTISSTSNAGTAFQDSTLLYLSRSGANAFPMHTAYGLYSTVTNTGLSSTNYGISARASGASDNTGIHGYTSGATGGTTAFWGQDVGTSTGTHYGGYFTTSGNTGTGTKYAVRGNATGTATTNYGIYATASGATTNWAGYFVGDTYVSTKIGVAMTPTYPLDVTGEARISTNLGVNGAIPTSNYGVYAYTAATSGRAIYGEAGGDSVTIQYGVYGYAHADTTNSYGLYGLAAGTGSANYGIYASASGANNNYAGVFDAGYVGIGDTTPDYKVDFYDWTSNNQYGAYFDFQSTYSPGDDDQAAIYAVNSSTGGAADIVAGVIGAATGGGATAYNTGVFGLASTNTNQNIGVWGRAVNGNGGTWGGYFEVMDEASGNQYGVQAYIEAGNNGKLNRVIDGTINLGSETYTDWATDSVVSISGSVAISGSPDYVTARPEVSAGDFTVSLAKTYTLQRMGNGGLISLRGTFYNTGTVSNASTVVGTVGQVSGDASGTYTGATTWVVGVRGAIHASDWSTPSPTYTGVSAIGVESQAWNTNATGTNYGFYGTVANAATNYGIYLNVTGGSGTDYGMKIDLSGTQEYGIYVGSGATTDELYVDGTVDITSTLYMNNSATIYNDKDADLRYVGVNVAHDSSYPLRVSGDAYISSGGLGVGVSQSNDGYIQANARIGVAMTPSYPLDVTGAARISTNLGVNGVNPTANYGVYSYTTSANGNAVRGVASSSSAGTNYGGYFSASGAGIATANVGVYATASGAGTINYGIFGVASGATTNWAGYFSSGDVYIANSVGLNTTGPDSRLDILDASNPQLRLTYTDGTSYTTFQSNSGGDLVINPYAGDEIIFGTSSPSNPIALIPAENNVSGYSIGTSAARWKTGYFVDGIVTGASSTTYADGTITVSKKLDVVLGGAANNDFTVDTDVLVVESDNNRIGVNNAAPGYTFDVTGSGKFSTYVGINGATPASARGINVAMAEGASTEYAGYFDSAGEYGIYVRDTDTSGTTYAGYFLNTGASTANYGLYADAQGATTNYGGYFTASGTGTNYGIYATASGSSGDDDIAGYFTAANLDGKYVVHIINTENNSRSDVLALQLGYAALPGAANAFIQFLDFSGAHTGAVVGDGAGGVKYSTTGEDYAEYFPSAADWPAGTVVKLGANGKLEQAVYGDEPLGVISSHPGFSGGQDIPGNRPLAMMGQVPVKITNEGGAIRPGDKVTVSSRTGFAKKVQAESDPILGVAAESFSGAEGQVKIFVSLLSGVLSASASTDGSLINGGLIEGDLGISGELDVAGTIKASSLWSQNATWHIDSLGEAVFQKVTAGDIEIIEGENKAIGRVILPGLQKEIFVPNNSVTSVSRIFLTIESANDASAGVKVKEKRPGQGFVISTIDGKNAPVDLPVDWLVIN